MQQLKLRIKDLVDMEEFASALAQHIEEHPSVIFLDGDLGAGKTTFAQYFSKALGVKEVVTSPTFTIFKRYEGTKRIINHFDLYRIQDQVYGQGFEEYWNNEDEVTLIEWATYLPNEFKSLAKIQIEFKVINENRRTLNIVAQNSIISYLKDNCSELIY